MTDMNGPRPVALRWVHSPAFDTLDALDDNTRFGDPAEDGWTVGAVEPRRYSTAFPWFWVAYFPHSTSVLNAGLARTVEEAMARVEAERG